MGTGQLMLTPALAPTHNEVMPIGARVARAEVSESRLVEAFRKTGEGHLFEALYLRSRRRVYLRCLGILKDEGNAEDVTHETFLRAYEQFPRLRGGNFSGWVSRIATNLSLNRLRDELNRRRILDEQPPARGEAVPGSDDGQQYQVGKARRVLDSLKEEQRTVLTLKYVHGYSYSEIEKRTGYSFDQVRSYLQNARRNFRIRWAKKAGGGEGST